MKTGFIIGGLGLLLSILGWSGAVGGGMSGGILTLFLGYPLIAISLVIIIFRIFFKR